MIASFFVLHHVKATIFGNQNIFFVKKAYGTVMVASNLLGLNKITYYSSEKYLSSLIYH